MKDGGIAGDVISEYPSQDPRHSLHKIYALKERPGMSTFRSYSLVAGEEDDWVPGFRLTLSDEWTKAIGDFHVRTSG